jgi:hypothetical protein
MTRRLLTAAAVVALALAGRAAADAKIAVKTEDAPPPNELAAPFRSLLDSKALSVYDDKGKLLLTIWLRKEFESKATADQVKAGLTYRELEESTVLGAVKVADTWTDFRKQRIKPGVYTLRLGFQPMDGDHMGTAPFNEFALLSPVAKDAKPDLMEEKPLFEMSSTATSRNHPSVMLLFPNPKPASGPAVEAKENDIWVVNFKRPVTASGQKAELGFSVVLLGVSMSE